MAAHNNNRNARGHNWVFTINNYTELDEMELANVEWLESRVRYIIVGIECGENGTPHLQGYVQFNDALTFYSVQTELPFGAHIEQARGSLSSNQKYCKKEGNIGMEWGTPMKQGKRSDLDKMREIVKSGGGLRQILEEGRSYQAVRFGILYHVNMTPREDRKDLVVNWFWGDTGTGKTMTAIEQARHRNEPFWISSGTLQWWDGYCGQLSVIIDDFRPDQCPFAMLLKYLDIWPVNVPIKGGMVPLLANTIWITAPQNPDDMYKFTNVGDISQLKRRIKHTTQFGLK